MTLPVGPFVHGHATHPDWRMALALCAAQIDGERSRGGACAEPTVGWIYFSAHYLPDIEALLAALQERWPGVQWVGGCGVSVLAGGAHYQDEPALALMLAALPRASFKVFSGRHPLGDFPVDTLQVHADLTAPDLPALVHELGRRSGSRQMFGAVVDGRRVGSLIADGALAGGVCGVAFDERVKVLTRVAQGCQPFGPVRRITSIEHNQVLTLDHRPALDCLLEDLGIPMTQWKTVAPRLGDTMAGLLPLDARMPSPGLDARMQVRRVVGVAAARGAVAVAEDLDAWQDDAGVARSNGLAFCRLDLQEAQRDLVRVCSEIRDDLLSDDEVCRWGDRIPLVPNGEDPVTAWLHARIAGAVYVSCGGRRRDRFAGPCYELETIRRALGDVPLVGLHAMAELADHGWHSYSGVLTVFVRQEAA